MAQPDLEIDSEFYTGAEHRPELVLLATMIRQAVEDVVKRPTFKPVPRLTKTLMRYRKDAIADWAGERAKALAWLTKGHDSERVMSFDWCCEQLGMNANVVRHRLHVTLGLVIDPTTKPFVWAS